MHRKTQDYSPSRIEVGLVHVLSMGKGIGLLMMHNTVRA